MSNSSDNINFMLSKYKDLTEDHKKLQNSDLESIFNEGLAFYIGNKYPKDYTKALIYFKNLIQLETTNLLIKGNCLFYIGKIYISDNFFISENTSQTLNLDDENILNHTEGEIVEKINDNYSKKMNRSKLSSGIDYFKQAAKLGKNDAYFELFIIYKSMLRNHKKCFNYLCKGAIEGHIESNFQLGLIYYKGQIEDGVNYCKIDYKKAFELFKFCADKNHQEAKYYLSLCYIYGHSTPKDYRWGFCYLDLMADDDHPYAIYELSFLYKRGHGVHKNLKIAFDLFNSAYENGILEASINIANSYENGEGTEKDLIKALEYYCLAKKHYLQNLTYPNRNSMDLKEINIKICNTEIKVATQTALENNKNKLAAYKNEQSEWYFNKASNILISLGFNQILDLQENEGTINSFHCQYRSQNCCDDYSIVALHYLYLCSGLNNSKALNLLGRFCETGIILCKNESKALDYYHNASSLGCNIGKLNYDKLRKRMEANEQNKLCTVCLTELKAVIFFPCGHKICCLRCAEVLISSKQNCPLDRCYIQGIVKKVFD